MATGIERLLIISALLAGWAARAQTDLETAADAYQRGDYDTAYTQFQKLAGQGQPQAQYYMGTMLENAQGVSRDQEEAAQWYRKAADQGNAQAQNALGLLYETGTGVPKNPEKAAGWYQKAADQGFAPAQRNLGQMYRQGLGVPQDRKKAGELLQKAADQGDLEAQKVQRSAPGLAKEAPPASTPERTFDNPPASNASNPATDSPAAERYWRNLKPGMYVGINPYPGFPPPPERIEEVTLLECSAEPRPKAGEGDQPSESLVTGTLYEYKERAWKPIGSIEGTFYHMTGKFKGTKSIQNSSANPCDGEGGRMWDASSYLNLDTTVKSARYICDQIPTNLAGNYRWESDRTKKCKIAQTGSFLDFTDEQGQVSKGIFWMRDTNSTFILRALDWPDRTWATIEDNDTTVQWRDGVKWIKAEKLDVANLAGAWYLEQDPAKKCRIAQQEDTIQATDENGKTSSGYFTNYVTVIASQLYNTKDLQGKYDAYTQKLQWGNDVIWARTPTNTGSGAGQYVLVETIADPRKPFQGDPKFQCTADRVFAQLDSDNAITFTLSGGPAASVSAGGVLAADVNVEIKGSVDYSVSLYWFFSQKGSYNGTGCSHPRTVGDVQKKAGSVHTELKIPPCDRPYHDLVISIYFGRKGNSRGGNFDWLQYVYQTK